MARRKLFDRPVDKEMIERAKQVCKEYTAAKRGTADIGAGSCSTGKEACCGKEQGDAAVISGKGAGTSENG